MMSLVILLRTYLKNHLNKYSVEESLDRRNKFDKNLPLISGTLRLSKLNRSSYIRRIGRILLSQLLIVPKTTQSRICDNQEEIRCDKTPQFFSCIYKMPIYKIFFQMAIFLRLASEFRQSNNLLTTQLWYLKNENLEKIPKKINFKLFSY